MTTDIYGTRTDFDAYWAEREALATYANDQKDKALVKASEWIDARYHNRFMGRKTGGRSQEREWPRTGHVDRYSYSIPSDEIPREIKYATYEAAKVELGEAGALSKNFAPSAYNSASVDGAVSVEFKDIKNVSDFQMMIAKVDEQLSGLFLKSVGSNTMTGSSGR